MHDWAPYLRDQLAPLRLAPGQEAAIVDELSQHLDERRLELIAGGVEPDEATRLTRLEMQRAELLARRLSALRTTHAGPAPPPGAPSRGVCSGFWQDLRYAVRAIWRQPVVAVVAVATLALGIGLNTAMFSFLNTLLLRPLPFPDSDRIVRLYRATPRQPYGQFSAADYLALRARQAGYGRFAGYQSSALALAEPARAAEWLQVSPDLFDLLGVPPHLGRLFGDADAIAGNDRVVVISHTMWQYGFGGARDVVGRTVRAHDGAYEIVGVLPAWASDHRLLGQAGVFSPLIVDGQAPGSATTRAIAVLGRRDPAVTPEQASAFVAAAGARMAAEFPDDNAGDVAWRAEPLPQSNTGPTGRAILGMLLGLSGFVLLIACSNLANLLLARAIERTREFAVRAALGASRLQLIRTLTLESGVMALAGGAGAVAVAVATTGWLRSVLVSGGGPAFEFPLDWRVLSFATAMSALTVILCSIVPALFTSRLNTAEALRSGGRGATTGRRDRRARHVLIVSQCALAMVLLGGAGFFLRGTANLVARQHGWVADRVVQGEIALDTVRYPSEIDIAGVQRQLVDRLRAVPGVASASVSYGLPYLGLRGSGRYRVEGHGPFAGEQGLQVKINGISPSYFDVTGTRLIAGRPFGDADTAASPKVVIVNETLARTLFPSANPVGRRVADAAAEAPAWMEIVGVVADVHSIDVAQDPAPFQLYQPASQDPRGTFVVAVRTAGAPAGVVAGVRAAIAGLDPDITVRHLMPVTARMGEITSQMRLCQQLLMAFAVLGLLLACLGIYGAMTRMVVQRTDEIGVRMALGARIGSVIGLVLHEGARIVIAGAVLGALGAAGLSRLLGSVLPGMQTDGALVAAAAAATLAVIALLACYLPARRATRVDPMVALRSE